jgi:hypothetical protein
MILILFKFFACPSPLYLDLCDRRQVDIIVITSIMCIHRHIVCYGEFSIMGHKIWSSFDRSVVWWRRRELYLDCKPLINIALMGLENCFCYIVCYFNLHPVKLFSSLINSTSHRALVSLIPKDSTLLLIIDFEVNY